MVDVGGPIRFARLGLAISIPVIAIAGFWARGAGATGATARAVLGIPVLASVPSGAVVVGGAVSDLGFVSGGIDPTGLLLFQLFSPDQPGCAGSPIARSVVAVDGDGAYRSGSVTAPAPGLYYWAVSYSGDANNLASSVACPSSNDVSVVLEAVPSLVTTAPASVPVGQPITDTAVLAGGSRPTGHLAFALFGPTDPACAGPPVMTFPAVVVAGDGTYSSSPFTPTTPGTYRFEVAYSGDTDNAIAVSRCATTRQATVVALSTLSITAKPAAAVSIGAPIVATVLLAGGSGPTGTLTFSIFGPNDAACSGSPAFTSPPVALGGDGTYRSPPFTPSAVGAYRFSVTYSGDADNVAVTTSCAAVDLAVIVERAIPSVVAQPAPKETVGATISASEALSGGLHPTGTMTFAFYGPDDPTCTRPAVFAPPPVRVDGAGNYRSSPFTPTAPGNYRFVAAYSGDADNIAFTTDCNAVDQDVVFVASARYDPFDHPRSVIELEVLAFALIALAAPAGARGLALRTPGSESAVSPEGSLRPPGRSSPGSVVGTGLDDTGEGPEALAVLDAPAIEAAEHLKRGDHSATWRWPGTRRLNALSHEVPKNVAPASPLIARIMNDAGYLRAIFGSASALLPLAGATLGVVSVLDVHGRAVPPTFWLAMALAALSVLDAFAGFVGVVVFVVGVVALGGVSTTNDVRTLVGLASLWFVAPIIAGVARPLRRDPTSSLSEHVERFSDVVIASLVGAWAVQQIVEGLSGLSGLALPITGRADTAALVVLAALMLRMVVETIAAHQYPLRLFDVQPEALPVSGTGQHVVASTAMLALFIFVAAAYVGNCWELYVGAAFFAMPIFLAIVADRFPNFPRLYAVIPRGILKTIVILVLGTVLGAFVASQLHAHNLNSHHVVRESFLLLSLPGLAVSLLELFGRAGPEPPKVPWLAEKILGAALLAFGLLFVIGVITV